MFDVFNRKPKDDSIDFNSMYEVVDALGIRGYKIKNLNVCKQIWNELVPESGQADTVQGELLRLLESLRWEAQHNGNHNWDDNYSYFCGFIRNILSEFLIEDNPQKDKLCAAIEYVKECGEYALKYNSGYISDDDVNPMLLAYTDDDLYDYIADMIAEFYKGHPTEIAYIAKDYIYR